MLTLRLGLFFAALSLAGCQTTAQAPPAQPAAGQPEGRNLSPVTPVGFRLPDASGCQGDVSRFRAIIDNDLATGHTTKSVHAQMAAELGEADGLCKAGNSGAASARVVAIKRKFGYPG
jgi:hypothetical protein